MAPKRKAPRKHVAKPPPQAEEFTDISSEDDLPPPPPAKKKGIKAKRTLGIKTAAAAKKMAKNFICDEASEVDEEEDEPESPVSHSHKSQKSHQSQSQSPAASPPVRPSQPAARNTSQVFLTNDQKTLVCEFLRDRPFLYARENELYYDREKKNAAWKEIGDRVGYTGDAMAKYCKGLKDRFGKASARQDLPSGSGAVHFSPSDKWLLQNFSFFADHITRVPEEKRRKSGMGKKSLPPLPTPPANMVSKTLILPLLYTHIYMCKVHLLNSDNITCFWIFFQHGDDGAGEHIDTVPRGIQTVSTIVLFLESRVCLSPLSLFSPLYL